MSQKAARLLLLSSFLIFALVALNFVSFNQLQNREKEKLTAQKQAAAAQVFGQVLPGSSSYYYKFYLKDAVYASNITGGSSNPNNYLLGASVTVYNQSSFTCGGSYTFEDYEGLYKIICNQASTMQVRIAKSGYQTRIINLPYYQGDIPTIYLSKVVPKPPAPPPETIKNINLPAVFKEKGSSTTDLSKIADTKKVANLTLDTKVNTIKYKEAVDLSSSDTKNKFKNLDIYVKADKKGLIGVDSKALPVLNKQATLIMKDLGFSKQPKIYVDGKEDKTVVSNVKYEKGTLSFDVTKFSTYTVVPEIEISQPKNNFETTNANMTLKGKVSDPQASLSAKLNDANLGEIKVSTESGSFSKAITLKEGLNKIVLTALSGNGATSSASLSATFVLSSLSKYGLVWFLLALFGLFAAALLVWSIRHVRRVTNTPVSPNPSINK